MVIGILSDSHGAVNRLDAALELFSRQGCQALVHCGDIVSPDSLELLAEADVPVHLCLGNMDRKSTAVLEAAKRLGFDAGWRTVEVSLDDDQHLLATHGDDEHLLAELIAGGMFPYLCHGHTHRYRDERIGDVRVINPGALWQPRDGSPPSVAVLDTATDRLQRLDLPGTPPPS